MFNLLIRNELVNIHTAYIYIYIYIYINIYKLYAFFWVIPRRLNFICRRFGILCIFHLHRQVGMKYTSYLPAYEDGTVFRNDGI